MLPTHLLKTWRCWERGLAWEAGTQSPPPAAFSGKAAAMPTPRTWAGGQLPHLRALCL